MVDAVDIQAWIQKGLPGSDVEVSGDGRHFRAKVMCPFFSGKTTLEQHKMVYDVLGDKMKEEIHALSLQTLTPEQEPRDDEE